MLYIRVARPLHWSASPWKLIKPIQIGDVVRFLKTIPPHNPENDRCDYHGDDVNKCRHLIVCAHGNEFRTNVCMEEARLYFELIKDQTNVSVQEPEYPTWTRR